MESHIEALKDIAEIIHLHDEAFRHYQNDPCCGGWKSSEGAVSVHFGNFWQRDESPVVEVYSYALGPSRNHRFDSTQEALEAVREWHRAEMAHKCDDDEGDDWDFASRIDQ